MGRIGLPSVVYKTTALPLSYIGVLIRVQERKEAVKINEGRIPRLSSSSQVPT
ncbi:MAG: hypothetical protein UY50_C0007G0009 [Parcubacteria group bacterium GW2011_GWA2_49_9]|nr:MAG: hypothetical protein UY50_C0007G0009 [Parcubacteria group bacterium GW2011_GWA2_49_9]